MSKSNTDQRYQAFKQSTIEQLASHQDRLNNMLACHRFMAQAVLALTEPERFEKYDDWHTGLYLYQRWMANQAEELSDELEAIQQSLRV